MDNQVAVSLVAALGILLMFFSALSFLVKGLHFRHWCKATGTIVELIKRETSDSGNDMFSTKIAFRTAQGEEMKFVSSVASNLPPKIGSRVSVIYNTNDPKEASIDSYVQKYLGETVCFGIGAISFIAYLYPKLSHQ